ncbi:IS3 family transposase, partial [Bifidobacterium longum]|uniref:IS3 family transposase n=1 Tax=Bifidobacterium longum TaxID=216816 RepID=UPI0032EFA6E3
MATENRTQDTGHAPISSPNQSAQNLGRYLVESTDRLVKKELIHRNVYTNVEQLRSDVNRYVWWYNHQRLHS